MRRRSTLFLSAALTALAVVLVAGAAWQMNRPLSQVSAASSGIGAGVQQETGAQQSPVQSPAKTQIDAPAATTNGITPQDAVRIAMRALPNSTLRRGPDLVDYQGTTAYALLLSRGVVVVDAASGDVLYAGGLGRNTDGQQPGSRTEGRGAQNDNHEFGVDSD